MATVSYKLPLSVMTKQIQKNGRKRSTLQAEHLEQSETR
ncbi:hypothetical protein MuYL_2737 [Mucilaginibacter xinganensis]|uniref:Uncharacterized protein n=1 Tax=Mucilaginibacter xinganensis TaxID=1234841 RepID=A0A223NY43_9SPHI|nr:hypothetical protein MuYL_2737 [Mucilaginibacter xinganensis]